MGADEIGLLSENHFKKLKAQLCEYKTKPPSPEVEGITLQNNPLRTKIFTPKRYAKAISRLLDEGVKPKVDTKARHLLTCDAL